MNSPTLNAGPELLITRTFRAPRQLVWKAWSDPKQLLQWFGPSHHPATQMENDFRTGASWRGCLTATDGSGDLWVGGTYREIVEPERLVFTFCWDGNDGKPETEMLITLTFAEEGPDTKMSLHQTGFVAVERRDDHRKGWNSTFDRLETYLVSNG